MSIFPEYFKVNGRWLLAGNALAPHDLEGAYFICNVTKAMEV